MVSELTKRALYGTPKVGGDILSYCTRCKMELAHVVVSMIDTRPAKVLCKTCRTQHNYRRVGGGGAEPLARANARPNLPRQTSRPTSVVRVAELWQQKLSENKSGQVKPYAVKESFRQGDVIQHAKFGMGLVEEVKRGGKITVLFRDGEKVLIHMPEPEKNTANGA